MDPNLCFQKCKQQYSDKLNEGKTPWVLVGTASSKHIKSAYRTAWTFIWPLMYWALTLRKCLKKFLNTELTGPKLFSVCFIGAMVCVPLPTFFAVFRCWRTKLMRRENGTKLKNLTFDLNLLLAPTRAHQVFICICFLKVSLFMIAYLFHGCVMAQRVLSN